MNLKEKTCLVYDRGIFVELAIRLSREFGKVLYHAPEGSPFPRSTTQLIGSGLKEIEVVENIWEHIDEVDLFVFPDVYDGALQVFLREMGHRVYGNAQADRLELDRFFCKDTLKRLGLPIVPYEKVSGITALRDKLEGEENKFVKISHYRGDMETEKHLNGEMNDDRWDYIASRLGGMKELTDFLVEDKVEGIEVGYDGYVVNGEYPNQCAYGYEIKDTGYVGKIVPYQMLPQTLKIINAKLAPYFKEEQARGDFSTEVRITKTRQAFLTDPCVRCGNPPTPAKMEAFSNLGEFMYAAAEGELIPLRPTGKFMAQANIYSPYADKQHLSVEFPERDRQWIKLMNFMVTDGVYKIIPRDLELEVIGAVVAIADTMNQAIELVKERAEAFKGFEVDIKTDSFDDALEVIEDGKKLGIPF